MLSRRHHELKISYLKHRLKNMPHGTWGVKRGKRVINITFDPMDPGVDSYHKKTINLDSKQGQLLQPIIEEAMKLQNELENMEALWRQTYWVEPREITYPLRRVRQPAIDPEFFRNAQINANTYKQEALKITYKGQKFRTKNEMSAAQVVEAMGYEFKSEIHVAGKQYDHYPDVTMLIPELEMALMSEIDGAMERSNYKIKSIQRQYEYFEEQFREFKDIVFLRMVDSQVFDPEEYRSLIRFAIETNIDDIIL